MSNLFPFEYSNNSTKNEPCQAGCLTRDYERIFLHPAISNSKIGFSPDNRNQATSLRLTTWRGYSVVLNKDTEAGLAVNAVGSAPFSPEKMLSLEKPESAKIAPVGMIPDQGSVHFGEQEAEGGVKPEKTKGLPVGLATHLYYVHMKGKVHTCRGKEYLEGEARGYRCGSRAMKGKSISGKHRAKIVMCGKPWCRRCGKDMSIAHIERMTEGKVSKKYPERGKHTKIDKVLMMKQVGYLVLTLPVAVRRVIIREGNNRIMREITRYWIRKLTRELETRGIAVWHYTGDRNNVFHPHLNVLFAYGYIDDAMLESWKVEFATWLNENVCPGNAKINLRYNYYEVEGKKWQLLRYVTRATMRDKGMECFQTRGRSFGKFDLNEHYQGKHLENVKDFVEKENVQWEPGLYRYKREQDGKGKRTGNIMFVKKVGNAYYAEYYRYTAVCVERWKRGKKIMRFTGYLDLEPYEPRAPGKLKYGAKAQRS